MIWWIFLYFPSPDNLFCPCQLDCHCFSHPSSCAIAIAKGIKTEGIREHSSGWLERRWRRKRFERIWVSLSWILWRLSNRSVSVLLLLKCLSRCSVLFLRVPSIQLLVVILLYDYDHGSTLKMKRVSDNCDETKNKIYFFLKGWKKMFSHLCILY